MLIVTKQNGLGRWCSQHIGQSWSGLLTAMFFAGRRAAFFVAALSLSGFFNASVVYAGKSSPFNPPSNVRLADFASELPSQDARHLADWIANTRDNGASDFIIVDKRNARVYVFDARARLRGANPVLLGAARGDESVPGIGSRPLTEVRPDERTTPAGRFIAERGRNLKGEDIVWVDYDAAVSIHRVRATNPIEQRLQRLATPTVADNRISYGCINVPVTFYESYIRPTVAKNRAVVYVLPEVKSVQQVFGSYDVTKGRRHASLK